MTTTTEVAQGQTYSVLSQAAKLFEDDDVLLTEEELVIKNYYFPISTDKHIKLASIKAINSGQELGLGFMDFKAWGMALNNIWWARHFSLNHDGAVVIETNSSIRKGCHSDSAAKIVSLVRSQLMKLSATATPKE